MRGRDRHVPRIDRENERALAVIGGRDDGSVVETDACRAVSGHATLAVQEVGAGEGGDEGIGGPGHEVGRRSDLAKASLHDHPDLVGERGRVLEVVRDEQRRDLETGEELLQLESHLDLRVSVEGRERLVEQEDLGVTRERARERDPLALAAREAARQRVLEMRDLEALEVLVRRVAPGVLDVLAHRQVGEERVVLEDEPHATPLRRLEHASVGVEPDLVVAADPADGRLDETGDRVEDGALARAARADEREGRADLEAQLEPEIPKRDGDLVEGELRHDSPILSVRRRTALIATSTALIARAVVKPSGWMSNSW